MRVRAGGRGGGDDWVGGWAGARRVPVAGGGYSGPRRDALDQRVLRHPDEIAGHDADRQAMPERDAIDLVLDRAGVGVDIDAGGVQCAVFGLGFSGICLSFRGWYSIAAKIASKTRALP